MSGIQNFIYTIPSKGALKSLRGRSLYLDVLLENIIDEILKACGVSRTCLIYSGGGHFYMLLPNTQQVKKVLDTYRYRLNDWFLTHYGKRLYMDYINIHSLDELWEMSRKYVEDSVIMQKEIFGKVYQAEFKKAELADIFLGGGPGFLSKTAYYALAPKDEGKKILARYFDDIFTNTNRRTKQREPAHYHERT